MLRPRMTAASDSERRACAAEVARLVAAYPRQDSGSKADGQLEAAAYLEMIAGQPLWAVHEARRAIFAGEKKFGDGPFGPTARQFADTVDGVIRKYRNDLAVLDGLLLIAGEVEPDPETKQMVSDGFDALQVELGGGGGAVKHVPTDDEIRAAGARWLAPRA